MQEVAYKMLWEGGGAPTVWETTKVQREPNGRNRRWWVGRCRLRNQAIEVWNSMRKVI